MKKKLSYFWGEITHAKGFLFAIFVELTLCILLLSIAAFNIVGANKVAGYYTPSMNEKAFVEFNTQGNVTVGELNKQLDTKELATATVIGSVNGDDIKVVTPAVINNMPKLGLKFSKKLPQDYREVYISNSIVTKYVKGQFYDFDIEGTDRTQRVKVMGFFDKDDAYYQFDSRSSILSTLNEIIMCDNLTEDAVVNSGLFFNDLTPEYYAALGYEVITGKDLYSYSSATNNSFTYFAIIAIVLTVSTLLTGYMLNMDKMRKRIAIQYVTGVNRPTIIGTELVKMIIIYAISAIINLGAMLISNKFLAVESQIFSYESYGMSMVILTGIYLVTIAIGLFQMTKIKPIEAITNDLNE